MSRLMSVAFTEAAVRERRKTVTRRKGWMFLKPGDTLTLCRKVMGRKKGEPLVRIAEVEVVSVRREVLSALAIDPAYGRAELEREGFPGFSIEDFIYHYFVWKQGMSRADEITRIEWRYLDDPTPPKVVLVTSEALMFAERAGIPWPDERPYEETLSDADGDLG